MPALRSYLHQFHETLNDRVLLPRTVSFARQSTNVVRRRRIQIVHVDSATDEWGHHAVGGFEHHGTQLHLVGVDHTSLIDKRSHREETLTDNQSGQDTESLLT